MLESIVVFILADTQIFQGTSSKTGICETCGEGLQNCNGHFGHVRLALPAFHIGYLKLVMNILQNICKVYYLTLRRKPGV
jgi:DNA-directed RNA polymerase beta' subunit